MANLKNTTINDSGFIRIPSGNTSQRPSAPQNGQTRINTDRGQTEIFSQDWKSPEFIPPDLDTTGLVLYLDAGNPQSYSGNGNTWFDLSQNSNNADINGNTFFSSESNGSFTVTSRSDSITIPYDSSLDFGSGDPKFTIETWVYIDEWPSSSNGTIMRRDDYDYGLALRTNNAFRVHSNNEGKIYYPDFPHTLPENRWYLFTQVFHSVDNDRTDFYVNGELQSSFEFNDTFGRSLGTSEIEVFDNFENGNKISIVRMYNRALDSKEVYNNFFAEKDRFNVTVNNLGTSRTSPAPTGGFIKETTGTTRDGYYWISNRTIDNTVSPRKVFCDMNTNGGGWMLTQTLHGGPVNAGDTSTHYTIQNNGPSTYEGFRPRRYKGPINAKGVGWAYELFKDAKNFNLMKTYSFWNGAGNAINYLDESSKTRIAFDLLDTGDHVTYDELFLTSAPSSSGGRTLSNIVELFADNGEEGAAFSNGTTDTIVERDGQGYGFANPSDTVSPTGNIMNENRYGAYGNARHWLVYNESSGGRDAIRCQPTCWGSEDVYQENSFFLREKGL